MQRSANESIIQGFIVAVASFISSDIILEFVWRRIIEIFEPLIIGTGSSEAVSVFTRTVFSYNIAMFMLAIGAFLIVVNKFNVELNLYHWIGFLIAWLLNSILMNLIYLRL